MSIMTKGEGAAVRRLVPAILLIFLIAGCGGGGATSSRAILRMEKYAAVASDAQGATNIWERSPTQSRLKEALEASKRANDEGFTVLRTTDNRTIANSFLEEYQASTVDVMALVGHNNAGTFRFADGSSIQLEQVGQLGGPALAVISCDSAAAVNGSAIGVPGAMTFEVAFAVSDRFTSKLSAYETLPARGELQALLTDSLFEVTREKRVVVQYKIGVAAGVPITAGVGIAIWQKY